MPASTIAEKNQNANGVLSVRARWQEVHHRLQQKQKEIINEIRAYPPPIPACDLQFNYLLEQRTAIQQELYHAMTLAQQVTEDENAQETLAQFICSSPFLARDML